MFITHNAIDLDVFLRERTDPASGAVASFTGVVRNHNEGRRVARLYYECYESMANKQITLIIGAAKKHWPLNRVQILHRVGWLEVGDIAVAIQVESAHREEAFSVCRFILEEIKNKVPIWKREVFTDGSWNWVLCSGHGGVHHEH